MSRLDAFWGDDRVYDVDAVLANLLLAAVILHLAGVAAMSWLWKENLPASSRLAAMKRAGKNITDLLENLRGTFHRLRQITSALGTSHQSSELRRRAACASKCS